MNNFSLIKLIRLAWSTTRIVQSFDGQIKIFEFFGSLWNWFLSWYAAWSWETKWFWLNFFVAEPLFEPHPMFRPHLPEAEVEEEIENSPLLAMFETEEQRMKDEAQKKKNAPHLMFEITSDDGFRVQADSLNSKTDLFKTLIQCNRQDFFQSFMTVNQNLLVTVYWLWISWWSLMTMDQLTELSGYLWRISEVRAYCLIFNFTYLHQTVLVILSLRVASGTLL